MTDSGSLCGKPEPRDDSTHQSEDKYGVGLKLLKAKSKSKLFTNTKPQGRDLLQNRDRVHCKKRESENYG